VPRRFLIPIALVVAAVLAAQTAVAQLRALSIIRDSEIENTLRDLAEPIFRAAGLAPGSVRLIIVGDKDINAFVSTGNRMFIHTGLILQSKSPGALMGVVAHETGHLAGGHLLRMPDAMRAATVHSVMAMVLGGVAGIASGRGDVGAAIAQGGMEMARRQFLRYTRSEETAADQGAINYLDRLGLSAEGFLELLETMKDQELLAASRQDPYLLTHPLTDDRIEFVRNHVRTSAHGSGVEPRQAEMFRRIKAKIYGFLEPAGRVLRVYKETDASLESRYARAIALFRQGLIEAALPLIDGLLDEQPDDPYFSEVKGQMLFQSHRVREALAPYEKAVGALPDDPLLRASLAQVQLEANDPALIDQAIGHLRRSLTLDRRNASAWRQLAIAHGRQGEMGESSLALAEEALLQGREEDAAHLAGRAKRQLAKGAPAWLRATDLANLAEAKRKKR
jgi:predicted Zn-dependent protease